MIRAFIYGLVVILAFGERALASEIRAIEEDTAEKTLRVERVLLDNSMEAATLEECRRTLPNRPRADGVVSFQNGSMTPWHHRTCYWTEFQRRNA